MIDFLLRHKLTIFIGLSCTLIVTLIIMVMLLLPPANQQTQDNSTSSSQPTKTETNNTETNADADDSQREGPTGGSGQPTTRQLVLMGWDTKNSANKSLAALIDSDIQNNLTNAILNHYVSKHTVDNVLVYGVITNVVFDESAVSFTVTVENTAAYTVQFTIATNTVAVRTAGGEALRL